jgi:UDP-N-acetylglucosamine 2-epimerase (non-hydrolysing)
VKETLRLLNDQAAYDRMSKAINPYGDGTASDKIESVVLKSCEK